MSFLQQLKSFDAYPKLNDEFKVKTFGGAIISLCALCLILLLFFSELSIYLTTETVDHLFVDTSRGEKLKINFDVTFPHIPCSLLSVDAMDVSGSHQLDVSHHIVKVPLDRFGAVIGAETKHELVNQIVAEVKKANVSDGTQPPPLQPVPVPAVDVTKQPGYCGPCYGAELRPGQCCNTCDEVRDMYRARGWALASLNALEQCVATGQTQDNLIAELDRGDGCRMYGYIEVNKVAGNFHFAPGKSFQHQHMHIHDLAAFPAHKFNVSHILKQISFGEPYPGIINPLDDTSKFFESIEDGGGMQMYYVKVVPTEYNYLHSQTLMTNQFSVTEHWRPAGRGQEGGGLPGVFFFYELSPIMVQFTETRKSLPHFLTQLCAILGGVFTVSGMIDALVFRSFRHMQKKNTQGKLI